MGLICFNFINFNSIEGNSLESDAGHGKISFSRFSIHKNFVD